MQSPETPTDTTRISGPPTAGPLSELVAELYDRSSIVADLDGPQIEAWVSGLFPLLDDELTASNLIDYCGARPSAVSHLLCAAIAELTAGIDQDVADQAVQVAAGFSDAGGDVVGQIGASTASGAWLVEAPFGRSVVIGFENAMIAAPPPPPEKAPVATPENTGEEPPTDLRHALLVEIGADGAVEDLQLTGPPTELVAEVASADSRVRASELDIERALELILAAWPTAGTTVESVGAGLESNLQFTRRRLFQLCDQVLPVIEVGEKVVDIRRGLDDAGFADANQAALSTLRAAVGVIEPLATPMDLVSVWAGVIRGDGGELAPRERDGLLWLEWADWLGAGIGMLRSNGVDPLSGSACVDFVNRCPEVSSSIDKADRDYAEWAFGIAIDLLADAGAIGDDGCLTEAGAAALGPAMVQAWS